MMKGLLIQFGKRRCFTQASQGKWYINDTSFLAGLLIDIPEALRQFWTQLHFEVSIKVFFNLVVVDQRVIDIE